MLLDTYAPDPELLVCVEQARGGLHGTPGVAEMQARAASLIATSWEGGEIYGYAQAKGFPCLKVGQQEWRTALVGAPRAGHNVDHRVEAELRRLLRQMPPRCTVHARDAAGVAIVGARMWLTGPYSTDRAVNLSSRIERVPYQATSPKGTP